jgi:hypothetical protein
LLESESAGQQELQGMRGGRLKLSNFRFRIFEASGKGRPDFPGERCLLKKSFNQVYVT